MDEISRNINSQSGCNEQHLNDSTVKLSPQCRGISWVVMDLRTKFIFVPVRPSNETLSHNLAICALCESGEMVRRGSIYIGRARIIELNVT